MFSSLILGGEPAWYVPLKEVKAARPVAEVSAHTECKSGIRTVAY